jgi:twitching motility two-component system response regulator PilG
VDANLDLALQALETGDQQTARAFLRQVVQAEPDNDLAWLWLAEVAESDQEHGACLREAHRISHLHDQGRRGGGLLGARTQAQGAPAEQTLALAATGVTAPGPPATEPRPEEVPVSLSVTVEGVHPPPTHVAVSHKVRLSSAPAAPIAAVAPVHMVPQEETSPPSLAPKRAAPRWLQWVMVVGVVLLLVVLIVIFVLVGVFLLEATS